MKNNKTILNIALIIAIMAIFAFLRVVIKLPNISPVAAVALFGGTFIARKSFAVLFPLMILFLSDLLIGLYSPFLMFFVYISFIIIAFIGFWLRSRVKIHNVIIASFSSSVLFFLLTNLGVWAEGLWYPMTWGGIISCYTLALPFFRYEILGTLGFTLVIFGIYKLITSQVKIFSTTNA